jgi:hypothetical protein
VNCCAHHRFLGVAEIAGFMRQQHADCGAVGASVPLDRDADPRVDACDFLLRLVHHGRRRAGEVGHVKDESGGKYVRHRSGSIHSCDLDRAWRLRQT